MLSEILKLANTTRITKDIESENEIILCLNENFLKLQESSIMTDEVEFENKIESWMYDELYISQIKKGLGYSVNDLFKVTALLTHPKEDRRIEDIEQLNVMVEEISLSEFNDYFDWGIFQVFLNSISMRFEFDASAGQRFYKFMDSDNPMILAFETKQDLFLFYYMGYI